MPFSSRYAADSDKLDSYHATLAAAASSLLVLDSAGRFPTLPVAGAAVLGSTLDVAGVSAQSVGASLLTRQFHITGQNQAVANNTMFDVVTFTGPTSNTSLWGHFSGLLHIVVGNRHTGGYSQAEAQLFYVSVCRQPTSETLKSYLFSLGNYESAQTAVTLTVSEKAGASSTLLTIEAKFTHANWGPVARAGWSLSGVSVGYDAAHLLTPASA